VGPPVARNEVTADQAADLLGVRLQTIYAYVSRGLLTRSHRTNEMGHRVSVLALDEVLRLAAERTRVRTGSLEVLVETDVTLLDPKGTLSYRGHDAVALASRPFEEAAALVWAVPDVGGWEPLTRGAWVADVSDRGSGVLGSRWAVAVLRARR